MRRSILFGVAIAAAAAATASMVTTASADPGWEATPFPETTGDNEIEGVDALAADDAWAVSWDFASTSAAYHWDGSEWAANGQLDGLSAQGLRALSPTDVWAFGFGDDNGPAASRWDGDQWRDTPVPATPGQDPDYPAALTDLDGVDSDDLWAVGDSTGGGNELSGLGFISHWDGSQWTTAEPPLPDGYSSGSVAGVTARAADDVWAVGTGDTGTAVHPLVFHYDGTEWTVSAIEKVTGELRDITAVDDTLWATGATGTDFSDRHMLMMSGEDADLRPVDIGDHEGWTYAIAPDGSGGVTAAATDPVTPWVISASGDTGTVEEGPTGPDGEPTGPHEISPIPGATGNWIAGEKFGDDGEKPFLAHRG